MKSLSQPQGGNKGGVVGGTGTRHRSGVDYQGIKLVSFSSSGNIYNSTSGGNGWLRITMAPMWKVERSKCGRARPQGYSSLIRHIGYSIKQCLVQRPQLLLVWLGSYSSELISLVGDAKIYNPKTKCRHLVCPNSRKIFIRN
jgi:hypothetical protein